MTVDSTPVRFEALTKTFHAGRPDMVTAASDVSFTVQPGRVVGLLGRNGAGKSTILRCLLGLAEPTSGSATLFGQNYRDLPHAAHRIGVTMDSIGFLAGATGRTELLTWARVLHVPSARVDLVLDRVGLTDSASRKVKGYSTGMRQRLTLAAALLADPEVLVLDEPTNGLDPDGVRWLRQFVRNFAGLGGTVLISSHQLAEVEQTVDDVVVLAKTVRFAGPLDELVAGGARLEDRFFELVDQPDSSSMEGITAGGAAAKTAAGTSTRFGSADAGLSNNAATNNGATNKGATTVGLADHRDVVRKAG